MRKLAIALFILVPGLVGCASNGGSARPSRDGPRPSAGRPAPREASRPGTGEEFTEDEKALMEQAFRAFKDDAPDWPARRNQWLGLGEKARNVLVENLLRAMVLARLANYPEGADRARLELIYLGSLAIPTVAGVLSDPMWVNPSTGEAERLPTEIQTELTELLLVNGESAVPALTRLAKSDVASVRRNAYDALGRMESPEGLALLVRVLGGSGDWIDRVRAAGALGRYRDEPRATDALVRALDDGEEQVVKEAARGLVRQGATAAIPALERRRAEARAAENLRLSAALGEAARLLRSER